MTIHAKNLCPLCDGDLFAPETARHTERCSACEITFA
jgi:hypothetical protein